MMRCAAGLLALMVLMLAPASAQTPRSPHGHWVVTEIAGNAVEAQVRTTFDLASNGLATGSTGCNRFRVKGKIRRGMLTFGQGITTEKMCEAAVMKQEAAFLAQLPLIRAWEIRDGVLLLADSAGKVLLRAERKRAR